jgi:hypothetical protein
VQGVGVLADIARELVEIMRRDVRTDWTVRGAYEDIVLMGILRSDQPKLPA